VGIKVLFFTSAFGLAHDQRFVALKMTDSIHAHHVWAFQKDSEFTDFFNYHLYRGVRHQLKKELNSGSILLIGQTMS
jgi:hypothetical protein